VYEKRKDNYPAQLIGSEARELNIIAMQEHGAVGYEGQVVMYSIA
jgi:RNase P/RNase MRP subunit p29